MSIKLSLLFCLFNINFIKIIGQVDADAIVRDVFASYISNDYIEYNAKVIQMDSAQTKIKTETKATYRTQGNNFYTSMGEFYDWILDDKKFFQIIHYEKKVIVNANSNLTDGNPMEQMIQMFNLNKVVFKILNQNEGIFTIRVLIPRIPEHFVTMVIDTNQKQILRNEFYKKEIEQDGEIYNFYRFEYAPIKRCNNCKINYSDKILNTNKDRVQLAESIKNYEIHKIE